MQLTSIHPEHDHVLGVSFCPKQYFTHISIWTKNGDDIRSTMIMERAILAGLSPDLRPKSKVEFSYRKHFDKTIGAHMLNGLQLPVLPATLPPSRPGLQRSRTLI